MIRVASRMRFAPPEVLGVDRRCRHITAPVKNNYPLLSQFLSAVICDEKCCVLKKAVNKSLHSSMR
jgi:hypothetical protein